jgi:integrase
VARVWECADTAGRPDWHGWHAFRRGLGSNLYALGVPEVTIQNILRHADLSTTMTYYVKSTPEASQEAMAKLEGAVGLTDPYLSPAITASDKPEPVN